MFQCSACGKAHGYAYPQREPLSSVVELQGPGSSSETPTPLEISAGTDLTFLTLENGLFDVPVRVS